MTSKKTVVSIWIKPEILDKLDKFAKKVDLKRSQLIHNLLKVGYDEVKLQKNLGIIKLTLSLKNLQTQISKLLHGAEKEIVIDETNERGSNVSVRFDPEAIIKIDDLALKLGMSRSTFIEYILEISIRELNLLSMVPGFIGGTMMIRDLDEKVREIWQNSIKKSEKALKEKKVISYLDEDSEDESK